MGKLSIVDAQDSVGEIISNVDLNDFPGWNSHPLFGEFTRRLYRHIGGNYTPCSFAVVDDNIGPVLLASCTHDGEEISFYGLPMVIALRRGLDKKPTRKAFAAAFDHIRQLADAGGIARARIIGGKSDEPPGDLDIACINQLAAPSLKIHAVVDVSSGHDAIRRNLRDSYRSLVNWGRRQLRMEYVNAENPDRKMFDAYRSFHSAIAGGAARSDAYWNIYWEEVTSSRGELSLGFLEDGELVAGTLIAEVPGTAYYASGVYDRSRFDKPLGHFPLFDAMVRAGERGIARFDLGEIFPKGGDVSDKEVKIGFFKKGFTDSFTLLTVWTIYLNDTE